MEIKHRGETYQVGGIYHPGNHGETKNGTTHFNSAMFEVTTIIMDKPVSVELYGVNLLPVYKHLRDMDDINDLALEAYYIQLDNDEMAREREE